MPQNDYELSRTEQNEPPKTLSAHSVFVLNELAKAQFQVDVPYLITQWHTHYDVWGQIWSERKTYDGFSESASIHVSRALSESEIEDMEKERKTQEEKEKLIIYHPQARIDLCVFEGYQDTMQIRSRDYAFEKADKALTELEGYILELVDRPRRWAKYPDNTRYRVIKACSVLIFYVVQKEKNNEEIETNFVKNKNKTIEIHRILPNVRIYDPGDPFGYKRK